MTWKNQPSKLALKVMKDADKLFKNAAITGLQKAIAMSPVDTGAYRGNHRVTLNSYDNTVNTETTDINGAATQMEGMKSIAKAKLGDRIVIQNALPYSIALENGHSPQAPNGVYSVAFAAMLKVKIDT